MKRIYLRMWWAGVHEPDVTNLCKRIFKKDWTAIDVGAQFGYHSLLFAKLVGPKGKVFSFEPEPKSFGQLCENIKINNFKNITTVKKATGEKEEMRKFFVPKPRSGTAQSFYNFKNKPGKWLKVPTVTLDNFFKDYSGSIDFVKIDIDGGEIETLAGMKSLVSRNPGIKMVVELTPKMWDKLGTPSQKLLDILRSYEFKLYQIKENGSLKELSDKELISFAREHGHANVFCQKPA